MFDTGLFRPDLTFLDWDCVDVDDLFDRLDAVLLPTGYVRPSWRAAVAERERAYPTGLMTAACGIALPHADAEHTARPFIAVVRPVRPVTFEPMAGLGDAVPAELVVCLGFTHDIEQVGALQHLMNVFMDVERVGRVLAQTTPEGLIAALAAE